MDVNKILRLMIPSSRQNVNFIKKYHKKRHISIFLENSNQWSTLTVLSVNGLSSRKGRFCSLQWYRLSAGENLALANEMIRRVLLSGPSCMRTAPMPFALASVCITNLREGSGRLRDIGSWNASFAASKCWTSTGVTLWALFGDSMSVRGARTSEEFGIYSFNQLQIPRNERISLRVRGITALRIASMCMAWAVLPWVPITCPRKGRETGPKLYFFGEMINPYISNR